MPDFKGRSGSLWDAAAQDWVPQVVAVLADGTANATLPGVDSHLELYNGATWDRQRGNVDGTLLASAARTALANSPTQTNHNARGLLLYVNVTAIGTGSLSLRILGVDPATALGRILYIPTALTAIGSYQYQLYPGATITGTNFTGVASLALPRAWSLQVFPADATSWTYSVGYSLLV